MLEQFVQNEGLVPSGMLPESYLEVLVREREVAECLDS